ncbi:MAG: acyl-CoA dehydrogenase protein [Frankiales bacterium]|nr:acyl-CoA dehydrogenase protein [Frankiales bacterium]
MTETAAPASISVEQFRAQARAWLEANLERRTDALKRTRGLVHRTVEDIAEQRALQALVHRGGYAGITWPVEYGGRGLTRAHELAYLDEAKDFITPDLGIAGVVTLAVIAQTALRHASEDFKQRHLGPILAGEELWAEFLSDPSAGSDLAGVTTTAVREGDHWVLNGSKVWSSGAYYADFGLCLARTDWDVPKHKGLTWFAVGTALPGVTVEPLTEITGDAEFCREEFHDVVIADSERIGGVGEGWAVAQSVLQYEREASSGGLTSVLTLTGPGPLAPDLVEMARRTGRTGDPHTRQLIATSHTGDFAVRALGARLARLMLAGHPAGPAIISYSKLAVGLMEPERAKKAMHVGGAAALAWEPGDRDALTFSLGYLNSRVTAIAGGTNEIQRNALGERVLGLPREPSFDRGKTFRQVQDAGQNWAGDS